MPDTITKDPATISRMFDAIAHRYDLLNRLLSLGQDQRWRRRAIDAIDLAGSEIVLDLCTGTADLALAARAKARRVVGMDFAGEMLRIAARKIHSRAVAGAVILVRADAAAIPLTDESVDAVLVGFGIRNVADCARTCREIRRVLKPDGRLVILEFSEPSDGLFRAAYLGYLRRILPRVGRLISRHEKAYSYLPASVAEFPPPGQFASLLRDVGFLQVHHVPLTAGIVSLYSARK